MATKTKTFNYVTLKKYDGMMGRCYRDTDSAFKNYGLQGIRVCSEWIKDINSFRSWVKSYLTKNNISEDSFVNNSRYYQLDRIDSKGHYTPENCRLVNPQTNTRNRKMSAGKIIRSAEGELITW